VRYTLHKLRLASNGSFLEPEASLKISEFEQIEEQQQTIDNNCFGAELY